MKTHGSETERGAQVPLKKPQYHPRQRKAALLASCLFLPIINMLTNLKEGAQMSLPSLTPEIHIVPFVRKTTTPV